MLDIDDILDDVEFEAEFPELDKTKKIFCEVVDGKKTYFLSKSASKLHVQKLNNDYDVENLVKKLEKACITRKASMDNIVSELIDKYL